MKKKVICNIFCLYSLKLRKYEYATKCETHEAWPRLVDLAALIIEVLLVSYHLCFAFVSAVDMSLYSVILYSQKSSVVHRRLNSRQHLVLRLYYSYQTQILGRVSFPSGLSIFMFKLFYFLIQFISNLSSLLSQICCHLLLR